MKEDLNIFFNDSNETPDVANKEEDSSQSVAESYIEEMAVKEKAPRKKRIKQIVTEPAAEQGASDEPEVSSDEKSKGIDGPATIWTYPLNLVSQALAIKEFNRLFIQFSKVKDPAGKDTDKFTVFSIDPNKKEEGNWDIANGLLSSRYNAASVQEFVKALKAQVEVADLSLFHDSFRLIWTGQTENSLSLFSTEEAKYIFGIVSGTNIDTLDNLSTRLCLTVTNSYNGTSTLRIDYSLKTTAKVGETDVSMMDFITMNKISTKVVHNNSLNEISAKLANVTNSVTSVADGLKAIELTSEKMNKIAKSLRKESKDRFVSLCENLTDQYRSVYYGFVIASAILYEKYSVNEHFALRAEVEKLLK